MGADEANDPPRLVKIDQRRDVWVGPRMVKEAFEVVGELMRRRARSGSHNKFEQGRNLRQITLLQRTNAGHRTCRPCVPHPLAIVRPAAQRPDGPLDRTHKSCTIVIYQAYNCWILCSSLSRSREDANGSSCLRNADQQSKGGRSARAPFGYRRSGPSRLRMGPVARRDARSGRTHVRTTSNHTEHRVALSIGLP